MADGAVDYALPAPHTSRQEREQLGRDARERTPLEALGRWEPPEDRADPIEHLVAQCGPRVPELVPIKFGRMMASPFAYLRGSPIVMAHDLAHAPSTPLLVQAAGDAHLLNFGLFASPERNLLFDVNDFDETHPGPWEWDVKRLAVSVVVAGRDNGLSDDACRAAAHAVAVSYAERMREYAEMSSLDIWYSKVDAEAVHSLIARQVAPELVATVRREIEKDIRKAHHRTNLETLPKVTQLVDGRPRIIDDPPLIHHVPETDEMRAIDVFDAYRATLRPDYRELLDRFSVVDLARKVVGVGSVGTRCYLFLLLGDVGDEPLFLQIKEAEPSVLERHTVPCPYENQGERVVLGQRLMQAASDVFLGWTKGGLGHHYYVRQLRDMKGSVRVDHFEASALELYGALCAWTLARAHARSSGAVRIATYLRKGSRFADAMVSFATAYADQNERDYEAFLAAVNDGRIFAMPGL